MIKRLTLTLMLLLSGIIVITAQDNTEAFPSDVATEIQAEMRVGVLFVHSLNARIP